jgi:hypothetical protein
VENYSLHSQRPPEIQENYLNPAHEESRIRDEIKDDVVLQLKSRMILSGEIGVE